jgi:hypothetical protein
VCASLDNNGRHPRFLVETKAQAWMRKWILR